MWGGEGDDIIYGGFANDNIVINGNEGDDIIYPGSEIAIEEKVRGGKGDDLINPVELEFDDAGMLITDLTMSENGAVYGALRDWRGGEGDDTIWGAYQPTGDPIYLGGNGDDTIYGSFMGSNFD